VTADERLRLRLTISPAAMIPVSLAAELMPFSDAKARVWLREHGLVRSDPDLGEAVVWGDVVEVFGRVADPEEDRPRPPSGLPRRQLRGQR